MDISLAGFDWDDGNWPKCGKHGLSQDEIESVFRISPALYADPVTTEARWRAIGVSSVGRYVFLAFTLRQIDGQTFIRPISARYMHDKEIRRYEQG
jgi:uncharacterized DUF497 family protein